MQLKMKIKLNYSNNNYSQKKKKFNKMIIKKQMQVSNNNNNKYKLIYKKLQLIILNSKKVLRIHQIKDQKIMKFLINCHWKKISLLKVNDIFYQQKK